MPDSAVPVLLRDFVISPVPVSVARPALLSRAEEDHPWAVEEVVVDQVGRMAVEESTKDKPK